MSRFYSLKIPWLYDSALSYLEFYHYKQHKFIKIKSGVNYTAFYLSLIHIYFYINTVIINFAPEFSTEAKSNFKIYNLTSFEYHIAVSYTHLVTLQSM